ncbi:MAG: branched-chain amino acid ABC transporter permease, partial [Candidatus Doudnabacteria bacterium]|nr:branched-chain amino acid ABC transporter permease [Candidatus Doudnabacteria bacterium]
AYLTYIDPATFTVLESITTLSAVILGGLANFRASILGSVLLVVLPEALRFVGLPSEIAGQMRNLLYGLLLILLMLYKPEGLMGKYKF